MKLSTLNQIKTLFDEENIRQKERLKSEHKETDIKYKKFLEAKNEFLNTDWRC